MQQIPGAPWQQNEADRNPWRKCHTATHWGYYRAQVVP